VFRLRRLRQFATQIVLVVVLGAAGVVTAAAVAGGNGTHNTTTKTGHGDHHNTGTDEGTTAAPETTETPPSTTPPPPPPPPVDPLAPPTTTPDNPLRPEGKAEAGLDAADLKTVLVGTASFLGDCLDPGGGSSTTDPVLCFVAAQAIITEALHEYKRWKDPPDPNFMQVALYVPKQVPAGTFRCPKSTSKGGCVAVNAAFRRWLSALAAGAAAARGNGVTVERFSGAVVGHSVPGAQLQAAAEKAYAGLTVSTKAAQRAAGVALGLALRNAHLDRLPTKSQFQARVKRMSTSKGYSRGLIQRLVADRVITSAADLDAMLKNITTPVSYVPLSVALSLRLPLSVSAALWRTTTVKDLAVLIRGLVGQSAVPASFGNTLLDELRTIAATPTPDARKPLIAKLVTDATALSGPAGILLAAGAGGLN
jgi:hypothetical protein